MRERFYVENGQSHTQGADAVKAGGLIFLAAIRGVDPAVGRCVTDDIREQARLALENMKTALATAGATPNDVVRIIVYFKDMADARNGFNDAYQEWFGKDNLPARIGVQVMNVAGNDQSRFTLDVVAAAPN